MESTENRIKSSETKKPEEESETEDPGTSSSVMKTQDEDITEIIDDEVQAKTMVQASEICLAMPVWDDDAPENQMNDDELDDRLLLSDDGEDVQDENLVRKETENIADDSLNTKPASEVKDLGDEVDSKIEDLKQTETKDNEGSKDLDQEADSSKELDKKECVQNESSNVEKKNSIESFADVKMNDEMDEDADSDVEVLRDDLASIRNSQDKSQEKKSEPLATFKEESTNEADPEMMILDDNSDEDNMYDLEVLDSWEEGAEGLEENGDELTAEDKEKGDEVTVVEKEEKGDEVTIVEKEEKGDEVTVVVVEEKEAEVTVQEEAKSDEVTVEKEENVVEVTVEEKGDKVTAEKENKVMTEKEKGDKGEHEERGDDKEKDEEGSKESENRVKDTELSKTLDSEVEEVTVMELEDESKDLSMKEMYETLFRLKEKELKNFDVADTASKAEITKLTESNREKAAQIVNLERELTELRSLVEKLENNGGEDSKESLLVMLSKKKLEVEKLNDTIEEIEDNLQKVFEEKVALTQKVEELQKRVQDYDGDKSIDERLQNRDAEIIRLKDELQDALDNVKLLESELQSSHAKEDMIIEKQLDFEENIKILEIDLEFAREKRLQETENYLNDIRLIEEKLSKADEQLKKEKKTNEELRSSLKEEMKVRINELKDTMGAEVMALKSEVESLKASELEALRKLEDHRSKMEVMTKQNRQLKADLKSKAMEVDAYANIAQQLKTHILKLEEKEGKKPKIENSEKKPQKEEKKVVEEKEEGDGEEETDEGESPEIITIDTDDQDSNGEDKRLNDMKDLNEDGVEDSAKSATKRQRSPVANDKSGKKLRLSSVGNSSMNNISVDDSFSEKLDKNEGKSIVSKESNGERAKGDGIKEEKNEGVATEVKDSSAVLSTTTETNRDRIYAELQEARRILAEKEEQLAALTSNVTAKTEAHISLAAEVARLQSELSGMIDARDKLQPQLVSLTEELNNEKSKVEMLAAQLHQRTVTEEGVLSEQQSRLATLQVQLKSIESELSERDAAIRGLQEEVSCLAADKVALTDTNQKLENEVAIHELERLKLTEVTEKFDRVSEELNSILLEREQLIGRISVLEAADAGLKVLKDKNEALQAELSVAVGEQERQKRLVLELTEGALQVRELQQSVDTLKSDVQEAQTKRLELIDEMTRRQQEVEGERDSLQRQVTEQQNIIMEVDTERKLSVEMAEASNRTVEDLRKELANAVLNAEQLQQEVDRLRKHFENIETQLTDKEHTIQNLRTKVQELTSKQEEKQIEAKKVDNMNQEFAEMQRELSNALKTTHLLTARVEQLHTEVNEKEKLRLKLEALEIELADVLQSRSDVSLKLKELRSETVKQDEYGIKLKDVRGTVTEMVAKREELNSRVTQLEESSFTSETITEDASECSILNVTLEADIKTVQNDLFEIKFSREDLQAKLAEIERSNTRLSERLRLIDSELRANSEGELDVTASKTCGSTDEIAKELIPLKEDVKRLVASETLLSRSVSELQKEVTKERSNYSTKLDANVDDVKGQLSELTALVAELKNKCEEMDGLLDESKKREAALKESLGDKEKAIEELKKTLKTAVDSKEILQNRLQLSLTNGRRMEAVLQKLQNSALSYKTKSVGGGHLQVVQRERDDLVKKLEDAENAKKRLKAKVITLAMTLKCKQNNLQNMSGQSVDLDSWEQVVNEVTTSSSELADCSKTESTPKSVLKTNTDSNRSDENDNSGQKRGLGGSLSCSGSASKKMCVQQEKLTTKRGFALNTITNSTPHSLVVQDQLTKSQSAAVAADTENKPECKVQ